MKFMKPYLINIYSSSIASRKRFFHQAVIQLNFCLGKGRSIIFVVDIICEVVVRMKVQLALIHKIVEERFNILNRPYM